MKKIVLSFIGFAVFVMMFSCSSVNVTRFSGSDPEVASSQPKMVYESKTVTEQQDIPISDPLIGETAVVPVTENNSSKQAKAVKKFNESAQYLAKELEIFTASVEGTIVKKTLTRTSNALSKMNMNADKLTFLDRIKLRFFAKVFKRYAEKLSPDMPIPDILAICALVAGILAVVGYYGSFVLSVAAVVLGVLAMKKGTSRQGMALAGIILGAVGLFLWLVLILFVI